jgi:hypothetical protein
MNHILRWEGELVRLIYQLQMGEKPTTAHFSGRHDDDINAEFYEQGKDRTLGQVMADFEAVRKQSIRRIKELKDRELTDPARFPALNIHGSHPLVDWIPDSSFAHEADHLRNIVQWVENRDKGPQVLE